MLLFFCSPTSGQSRRAEGFLAQVLQRRHNHDTFLVRHIDCEARPDLAARFDIEQPPAFVVVEHKRLRAKIEQPRGCAEIESFLHPWLK
jgi:thioredoxin-like negative regulator of GroEL